RATSADCSRTRPSRATCHSAIEVLTMDVNRRSNEAGGNPSIGRIVRVAAGTLGLAAAGYAATSAFVWARYGHPPRANDDEEDSMLDRFMPTYEIVERHHITVD